MCWHTRTDTRKKFSLSIHDLISVTLILMLADDAAMLAFMFC